MNRFSGSHVLVDRYCTHTFERVFCLEEEGPRPLTTDVTSLQKGFHLQATNGGAITTEQELSFATASSPDFTGSTTTDQSTPLDWICDISTVNISDWFIDYRTVTTSLDSTSAYR
ncbi:uncharacterized protein LOC117210235 [Bombus bifarius]|uniref:Uncharacterized protein LOC117210235 n=1 Tax=Bombus bifarius TaxID=103933 RepID=A0A6P8MHQ2_9HYME|nr:uncharacterized protein LOC117210235 [Bombus bifarius]